MSDQEVPWGQVVESDQIYSAKLDRWYDVVSTVRRKEGVVVTVAGQGDKRVTMNPQDPHGLVTVRRGTTGKVVDIFVEVMSSR